MSLAASETYFAGRLNLVLIFCTTLATLQSTPAEEPPRYFLFKVRTDLQRVLVDRKEVTDVLIVDGGKLRVQEKRFVESSFDFEKLKGELKDDRRKGGTLAIYHVLDFIKYKEALMNRGPATFRRFDEFAKSVGFTDTVGQQDHGSISYEKLNSEVSDFPAGDATTTENAIKKKGVSIYPVRTRLSRFLTMNADCVIEIEAPVDEHWDGLLDPDVFAAIKEAINDLKLDAKQNIQFRVHYTKRGGKSFQDFAKNQVTAEELGFQSLKAHFIPVRRQKSRD